MKRGFFSKATAILLAVCLCIPGLPKTVKADPVPGPITGEISSSVTWSDGDTVGGVTIHGGTADAPVAEALSLRANTFISAATSSGS